MCNLLYALLVEGRDEKGRRELDQSLYAPAGWSDKSLTLLNARLKGGL